MEDSLYKKRGGRKNKRKAKPAVTHLHTLRQYDDDDEDEEEVRVVPKALESKPKEARFVSSQARHKLFAKEERKDKAERKRAKLGKRPAEVNAAKAVKRRKVSEESSVEEARVKSFTPEGEGYDYEVLCGFEPRLKTVMVKSKNSVEGGYAFTLDWKNKMTRYYLNKAILHHDYGLEYYELPEDEGLVPTVPSRREYIHWIHDLFENSEANGEPLKPLKGLDVGVGASVIYPIIGAKEYSWTFTGSDIWEESLKIAQGIIDKNSLQESISLKHQPNAKHIFENVVSKDGEEYEYDFSMCNPPFFSSLVERTERRSVKSVHSRKDEDVTEGGEIGFLCRMVKESVAFKHKIKWFTAFIGRKIDFVFLCKYLECMLDDIVYTSGTIEMGHTKRWLIAWKFVQ